MRIIGHMIVGPGEADRYLDQVLDRAYLWADEIHVALDAAAGGADISVTSRMADAWEQLSLQWVDHEARFRQAAWESMVEALNPEVGDYIVIIDADEVIFDYDLVRKTAVEYAGKRIGFTFHEMWSPTAYRNDRLWKPYRAWIMIPFQHGGHMRDRPIACGREPTYAKTLPLGPVVGDLLHYGYARKEDREQKYERYMLLDGGAYHNPEHLKSILYTPSLVEWTKGGLLDV